MTTIGSVEISTIFELDASQVIRDIIPDASPPNIQKIEWLAPHYADGQGNITAVNQSFLLKTPNSTIVVDTGVGNGRQRPEFSAWADLNTAYLGNLKQQIDPQAVDFVICTHLHFDHIGWNTVLVNDTWTPLFPKARYIFVQGEFDYWMGHPAGEDIGDLNGIEESVKPLVQAGLIELVAADAHISDGVRLIPTPGHTPHHTSVLVESADQSALFTGDVFHHPCQIARPDWMSFDTDGQMALASRQKLLKDYADTDTVVFGTHFSAPTGGRIITAGQTYKLEI